MRRLSGGAASVARRWQRRFCGCPSARRSLKRTAIGTYGLSGIANVHSPIVNLPAPALVPRSRHAFATIVIQTDKRVGNVKRIKYRSIETDWSLATIVDSQTHEEFDVVGVMPGLQTDATYTFDGIWQDTNEYGTQLHVDRFAIMTAASSSTTSDDDKLDKGLVAYLADTVPKVGETRARRIVEHFGEKTRDVLAGKGKNKDTTRSDKLQEVKGISEALAKDIVEHFQSPVNQNLLGVFTRLVPFGISTSICKKIAEIYPGNAANIMIDTNPYALWQNVPGLSFKDADEIALSKPDFAKDNPTRIRAGIFHRLSQRAKKEGHTAEELSGLLKETLKLLNLGAENKSLMEALIRNGDLDDVKLCSFSGREYGQLQDLAKDEADIADFLKRPRSKRSRPDQEALTKAAMICGYPIFSDTQIDAINAVAENGVAVVTGGPGCGKSAIIPALLSVLYTKKVEVVAPTGVAAQKLQAFIEGATSSVHSNIENTPTPKTIHRLLAWNIPADCSCVIVDEASMVDTKLAARLIRALSKDCDLVLVGDPDQLPSIGPGTFLHDIIKSGIVPLVRLEKIFRQSSNSAIIDLAHAVNSGKFPNEKMLSGDSDVAAHSQFQFVGLQDQAVTTSLESVLSSLPKLYGPKDVQVLAPMHARESGIKILNTFFQDKNPAIEPDWLEFKEGDKVIQTRNNYELGLFNGMVGVVKDVNEVIMTVSFDDGSTHNFDKCDEADLADLELAYAISIHKSQGSEYPVVIVVISKDHLYMLRRKLLYTAITRAKEKLIIIGDPTACKWAAENNSSDERCCLLRERLTET